MKKLVAAGALALSLTAGPLDAAATSKAPAPVYLQALVPTFGGEAAALLDGSTKTGWMPADDAGDEGVLFRFEQPLSADFIKVAGCEGAANGPELSFFVDGAEAGHAGLARSKPFVLPIAKGRLSSFFLRVDSAPGGGACVGEVTFLAGGNARAVKPPRSVSAKVSASSTLAPIDAYHPSYLFDGRLDFGWVEGAADLGVGQSMTLEFVKPVEIAALELWNGYQRSDDHFKKNARAKKLSLRADDAEPVALAVKDASGPQKLALPAPVTAKKITLTIDEAIPGSRYKDLVLSELRLWDTDGPVQVVTADAAERRDALAKEIAGNALRSVVDRRFTLVCGGEADPRLGRFKLRSNHTLVWYSDSEDMEGIERRHEVLDGTWVVSAQGTPWSTIDLFARRHRTQETAIPYGTARKNESSRIAGGSLRIARVEDLGPEGFAKLVEEWSNGPASAAVACVGPVTYEELVRKQAIVVQGKAITDLLWWHSPNAD